jgi:hypothetical protein
LSAQDITVSGLEVTSGTPTTVTFDVSWTRTTEPKDSAWVFVDYNHQGAMKRLPVKSATATPPGTVLYFNDSGAWVKPSTGSSVTVQLLTETVTFHGACVYAINYPPMGKYTAANKIKFTGTPPYTLTFSTGSTVSVSREDAAGTYTITEPGTLTSFTDASKAPGIFACALPASQTLTASAAGYCKNSQGVRFALNDRQEGVTYQLIKNNATVVATLSGTGAATFSGTHLAGTYTARTVAGAFCAVPMSGEHTIIENPLPDSPNVTHSSRCGDGTVNLLASSNGAVIDWYAASNSVDKLQPESNTYTVNITGTKTYYTEARISATGCTSTARTPVTATKNNVPANPSVTHSSRCGDGTVNLLASSTGAVIDWYAASNSVDKLQPESNTYTVNITGTKTYYTEARISATGCTSTARTPVTATRNPPPGINLLSAQATTNQTAYLGYPIADIKYTTENATGATFNGFPDGLNKQWSSNTATISGSISANANTGDYSYNVATVNSNNCSNATLTGFMRVDATPPMSFASTQTWSYGGSTFSDVLQGTPGCPYYPGSNTACRDDDAYYYVRNGYYFYSAACVAQYSAAVCPSGWRLLNTQSEGTSLTMFSFPAADDTWLSCAANTVECPIWINPTVYYYRLKGDGMWDNYPYFSKVRCVKN